MTSVLQAHVPEPGWYDDPGGSPALRWWDGVRWTERTRERPQEPAPVLSMPVPEPDPLLEAAGVQDDVIPWDPHDAEATGPLPRATDAEPVEAPATRLSPQVSDLLARHDSDARVATKEEPPAVVPQRASKLRFEPVRRLAQVTSIAVLALGVVTTVAFFAGLRRHALLGEFNHRNPPKEVLGANDSLYGGLRVFQVLLVLGAATVLLVWFRRCYANVDALGARELRHPQSRAVSAWLVPGPNTVRPLQMVQDSWKGSDPKGPSEFGTEWQQRSAPGFLQVWWVAAVAAVVLVGLSLLFGAAEGIEGQVTTAANTRNAQVFGETVGHLTGVQRFATLLGALGDGAGIVACAATALVVHALSDRQSRRARKLGWAV